MVHFFSDFISGWGIQRNQNIVCSRGALDFFFSHNAQSAATQRYSEE
jgi:hypothetical protein